MKTLPRLSSGFSRNPGAFGRLYLHSHDAMQVPNCSVAVYRAGRCTAKPRHCYAICYKPPEVCAHDAGVESVGCAVVFTLQPPIQLVCVQHVGKLGLHRRCNAASSIGAAKHDSMPLVRDL